MWTPSSSVGMREMYVYMRMAMFRTLPEAKRRVSRQPPKSALRTGARAMMICDMPVSSL